MDEKTTFQEGVGRNRIIFTNDGEEYDVKDEHKELIQLTIVDLSEKGIIPNENRDIWVTREDDSTFSFETWDKEYVVSNLKNGVIKVQQLDEKQNLLSEEKHYSNKVDKYLSNNGDGLFNKIELNGDEYRKFLFKLLNEDQNNLGHKLSLNDEIVKAYFYEPSTNDFIEAELDTLNKTISANDHTFLIYDKFINGDVELLHTELKSIELFKEIEDKVKDLRENHNITYDTELFGKMVDQLEKYNFTKYTSANDIKELFQSLENTNNAIKEIDNVLEKVNLYRDTYKTEDNIMNFEVMTNAFEVNSKIDIYQDSFYEMRNLYEKQAEFQKSVLKVEVENFLADKSQIFKNTELNPNNTSVAEYINKTNERDLSSGRLIPLVTYANENNYAEKIRNNMLVHNSVSTFELHLKQMELYNSSVSFSGSKLEDYISHLKEQSLDNVIKFATKEFQMIYGENFKLFNEDERLASSNKLFEKLLPIVQNDTFSLYELQKIEPVTKSEFEVRDFWENKNLEMLLDYKNSKGIHFEANINDLLLQSKDRELVMQNVPDLTEEKNDINNKKIERIKEAIEDTSDSVIKLRKELTVDRVLTNENPFEPLTDEQRITNNIRMNNILFADILQNKVESLSSFVSMFENENSKDKPKEKENQREMELER